MYGYGHPFTAVQPSQGYPAAHPSGGMFAQVPPNGVPPMAMGMYPGAAVFPTQQPMYQLHMMQGGIMPGQQFLTQPAYNDGHQPVQSHNGAVRHPVSQAGHQPRQAQTSTTDEAKQRHFAEQQKRLQEFGSRSSAGRKMDADTLIASIIGKTDNQQSRSSVKSNFSSVREPTCNSVGTTTVTVAPSDVDDSFGDFLSGVLSTPATVTSVIIPPTISRTSETNGAIATNNLSSTVPDVEKNLKKDLQSMMLECSDLTAPAQARNNINKKPAVRDVHIAKPSTITYSESRSARHWSTDQQEDLSKLFTLPAPPVPTQSPSAALQQLPQVENPARRSRVNSGSLSESPWGVPLPRWVTGELPSPDLYLHILQAVTSNEGCIQTDLVYPVLLRSNLPREVLGYIWEMCNKLTPGHLVREELFLILAMISIAQNNMDYRSLAILSRCLQAPIPNLATIEQPVLISPVNSCAVPVSPDLVAPIVAARPVNDYSDQSACVFEAPVNSVSGLCESTSSVALPNIVHGFSYSDVPSERASSGQFCDPSVIRHAPTQFVPGNVLPTLHPSLGLQMPMHSLRVSDLSSLNVDEDEFADFQAASTIATGVPPIGPSLSTVSQIRNNTSAAIDLFQAEEDKYAVFRMMPSESNESQTRVTENKQIGGVFGSIASKSEEDKSEFADFASFHTSPGVASSTGIVPGDSQVMANVVPDYLSSRGGLAETPALSSHILPASSLSITSSSSYSTVAVGADKYDMIKQLVGNSALFKSSPVIDTDLNVKSCADAEDEWAEFQSLPSADSSHGITSLSKVFGSGPTPPADHSSMFDFHNTVMPISAVDNSHTDYESSRKSLTNYEFPKMRDADQESDQNRVLANETDQWAEFQTSPVSETQIHSKSPFDGYVVNAGKKDVFTASKVDWLDPSKVSGMFAKQPAVASLGVATSYSSGALDFSPPEFPSETDDKDDDDFGFFRNGTKQKDMLGVSSLSNIDFEEDFEDKTIKMQAIGKSSGVGRMTESTSTSSFEFTGWTSSSVKATDNTDSGIKAVDSQSTDSLDLQPSQVVSGSDSRSQDDSPSHDSKSISSLEFSSTVAPTVVTSSSIHTGFVDTEVKSIRSLELTSPDDLSACTHKQSRDVSPSDLESRDLGDNSQFTGWPGDQKTSSKPVDVKDLLVQGSLGMFGDRYSLLIHELQANDRHAYEWERCLEQNRNLLTQVEESFSSVSSSAICHELEVVEEGANFLSDLTEVYLVARRIMAEMKAVSISNARLALLMKDIEGTWNNLAAIFTKSPYMASCLTFDLTPAIVKSDDYGSRERACGLCLLDVDWESRSKLSYGGRYYHSACANFWINFVDLTLPSLTVPELL